MSSHLGVPSFIFTVISTFAGCTAVAAVIVLIFQLRISQRARQDARDTKVVGKWRPVLASHDVTGFLASGAMPSISLHRLVATNHEITPSLLEPRFLVHAGWANFLNSIGFSPEDDFPRAGCLTKCRRAMSYPAAQTAPSPFSTERATGLIEKRFPMRWNGDEFVCLCAVLGFEQNIKERTGQVFERTVFPLPALWFGRLGHLTLVKSPKGIVASFRARTYGRHALYGLVHHNQGKIRMSVKTRAYYSVLALPPVARREGQDPSPALYFGGTYSWEPPAPVDAIQRLEFEEEQIYNTNDADLLQIWRLDHNQFRFIRFHSFPPDRRLPNGTVSIAGFILGGEMLSEISASLLEITPDGYVFTAHQTLHSHLIKFFKHAYERPVRENLSTLVAEPCRNNDVDRRVRDGSEPHAKLRAALIAIDIFRNVFSDINALKSEMLALNDCQALAQLARMTRHLCGDQLRVENGREDERRRVDKLRWAMICSPNLVEDLSRGLRDRDLEDVCREGDGATIRTGLFTSTYFLPADHEPFTVSDGRMEGQTYNYSKREVLAAVIDFVFTATWVIGGIHSNICYEALSITGDVFMI
ncbi:hypothetical protein FOXYS1_4675 [Fusarium oxysporum]|uniref:Uncharacterized protein n=1 Tax=Fusarium oxysporum TaxID=5507 RepID=A0A8H5AFZ6_FUSOX|nr:hypothetical protein FOXYS1_4675 [Fusarium oxysporum]